MAIAMAQRLLTFERPLVQLMQEISWKFVINISHLLNSAKIQKNSRFMFHFNLSEPAARLKFISNSKIPLRVIQNRFSVSSAVVLYVPGLSLISATIGVTGGVVTETSEAKLSASVPSIRRDPMTQRHTGPPMVSFAKGQRYSLLDAEFGVRGFSRYLTKAHQRIKWVVPGGGQSP